MNLRAILHASSSLYQVRGLVYLEIVRNECSDSVVDGIHVALHLSWIDMTLDISFHICLKICLLHAAFSLVKEQHERTENVNVFCIK